MQNRVLKVVVLVWLIQAIGGAAALGATTFFTAATDNTTLDSNDFGGSSVANVALTGTAGNLDFVNSGVSFHDARFGSTSDINAMIGGGGLTATNVVTVQWTVDSVDFTNGGELRSRGIYVGLTSAAADSFVSEAENLVLRVGGGDNSGAVSIQESTSFAGGGSQTASAASVGDGFGVTLTASLAGGWQFNFTDITTGAGAAIHPISGTFSNESEFLAVMGGGHFYMAQQLRDTDGGTAATTTLNISEASIAVSTSSVPEVVESLTYFNLAKYQATTASASGGSIPPQFATDGFVGMDSRWGVFTSGPHWLQVSLATPMTIGSSHLYLGTPSGFLISNFVLQYHDGSNWIDIPGATVTGNILPVLNLEFNSPVTAKDFRLYTTQGSPQVKEIALYAPTADGAPVPFGSDLDLNVAKMRQYAYSSVSGNNYPKLAFDGYAHTASAWASANTAGPHDLEIHLTHNEAINGIHLYSGTTGVEGSQIQNFEVAYHDGTDWVLFDGGAVSNNTNLNRVVMFNSTVTATKIRLRSLDFNQAFVREFVVLPDDGGAGYPLWTDVKNEAPPSESFLDYGDAYYTIENRDTGLNLSTAPQVSVVTAETPWFQVLLNLGTDTYRLRSKESEACFEVALASTNAGAAIVEGTYSSMPHQRWLLVDTGDGTHFQIVNAWSGLALDVSGTDVVQSALDASQTQQWKINYETHFPKRGQNSAPHFNSLFKPSWSYNWRITDEELFPIGQYMPMQWGGMNSTTPSILFYQPTWYGRANQTTVMGFNEPDKSEQSNISEEDAAYRWPRFERMRLPLVGPCPAQNNGSWRKAYEAIATEQGFRCEYMGLHWYAGCNGGSPQNIINVINNVYNAYGKPIWITEFAVKDWSGTSTSWDRKDNYNWLAEFLWRSESIEGLAKFSMFEWGNSDNSDDIQANDAPTMGLHNKNDSTNPGFEDLSEIGLLMAGWDGDDTIRDSKAYIVHNKLGMRLMDDPFASTIGSSDILNRSQAEQFELQPGPSGTKYIVGLSSGRRLSCNGSTVSLAAAETLGTAVEWELTSINYGWVYIDHPSTGKRLYIYADGAVGITSDSNAWTSSIFRFITPVESIVLPEIQTLPYVESFEAGFGAWQQASDDDFDWSIGSGETDSSATGPTEASDGTQYLFVEGHDGGQYATTSIDCLFDLSAVTSAELSFDYHMIGNGSDMGTLALDVGLENTWSSNVWSRSGNQQTAQSDPFLTATVDLAAFVGNSQVTLRFRYRKNQWAYGDPAIDYVRVVETSPYAQWAGDAFSGAPEGTDQSASGNPDGDRFSNLQEWALVTDPLTVDSPMLDTSVSNANFVALYERRDPSVTGVDVYASWATSLFAETWRVHGDGMTETSNGWSNDVETILVLLPLDHTNAYIRIEVEE